MYSRSRSRSRSRKHKEYAAPYHRDKGLFLLVTPFTAAPLEVRDRMGEEVRTEEVDQDSLLLLLGSGLPAWLLEGTDGARLFHSPSHAVPSLPTHLSQRTTLARMKVRGGPAEDTASFNLLRFLPRTLFRCRAVALLNFSWLRMRRAGQGRLVRIAAILKKFSDCCEGSELCSTSASWSSLLKSQCEEGKYYCWMSCLDLPSNCSLVTPS